MEVISSILLIYCYWHCMVRYSYLYMLFQVYHIHFQPLEFTVADRDSADCYMKLIVNKADNVCLHALFNAPMKSCVPSL